MWITDHSAGRAILLSPRTGRRLRTVEAGRGTHHVAFGMGLAVVASHDDGMIHVFVAANGNRQASYRLGRGLHGVGLVLLP